VKSYKNRVLSRFAMSMQSGAGLILVLGDVLPKYTQSKLIGRLRLNKTLHVHRTMACVLKIWVGFGLVDFLKQVIKLKDLQQIRIGLAASQLGMNPFGHHLEKIHDRP